MRAGTRRVYVLPSRLVAEVQAFQERRGLPSEVEAVREFLDHALAAHEDGEALCKRLSSLPPHEAIGIAVHHPQVTTIHVTDAGWRVECGDGSEFEIPEPRP